MSLKDTTTNLSWYKLFIHPPFWRVSLIFFLQIFFNAAAKAKVSFDLNQAQIKGEMGARALANCCVSSLTFNYSHPPSSCFFDLNALVEISYWITKKIYIVFLLLMCWLVCLRGGQNVKSRNITLSKKGQNISSHKESSFQNWIMLLWYIFEIQLIVNIYPDLTYL